MAQVDISAALERMIEKFGYKSANFRFALVKEKEIWKVLLSHILLDVSYPTARKTLMKDEGFALEDFSLPINAFRGFLDYLCRVYVGKVTFEENHPKITDELFFKFDSYELCFVGNFTSNELLFSRTEYMKQHGINRPAYHTDYAIYPSVGATLYKMDLTHHEVPFEDVTEAINHYWGTNFPRHSGIMTRCTIFMPIFDGHIEECRVNRNILKMKLHVDQNRMDVDEFTLAVIARSGSKEYRMRHRLVNDSLEINLAFEPSYVSLVLHKNREKLDEYHYTSPKILAELESVAQKSNTVTGLENIVQRKKHVIYIDGSYKRDRGGTIAWYNETTQQVFHDKNECGDNIRCEYAAVLHALLNAKDISTEDEIEILSDSDTVINQLTHEYAINEDDLREYAKQIWSINVKKDGRISFRWVSRQHNKIGKMLGK